MGFSLKKVATSLQPAKVLKSSIKSAGEINAAGFQALAGGVQAFGGVVGAGTQIMRSNPELAGLAGNALGMPELGAAFSGPAAGGGGGYAPTYAGAPVSAGGSIPVWVWVVAGVSVVGVVLILVLRK